MDESESSGSIAEQLDALTTRAGTEGYRLYDVYVGTSLKPQQHEITAHATHLAGRECSGMISASLPADCVLAHLVGPDGTRRTVPLYWAKGLTRTQQETYRRLRLDHTDRDRAERLAKALH